jgi:hypothetical protein
MDMPYIVSVTVKAKSLGNIVFFADVKPGVAVSSLLEGVYGLSGRSLGVNYRLANGS